VNRVCIIDKWSGVSIKEFEARIQREYPPGFIAGSEAYYTEKIRLNPIQEDILIYSLLPQSVDIIDVFLQPYERACLLADHIIQNKT